jgi:hypothetical protein
VEKSGEEKGGNVEARMQSEGENAPVSAHVWIPRVLAGKVLGLAPHLRGA